MILLFRDYEEFLLKSKKIINCGYDLKFILPVIPYFKDKFEIRLTNGQAMIVATKSKAKKWQNDRHMV